MLSYRDKIKQYLLEKASEWCLSFGWLFLIMPDLFSKNGESYWVYFYLMKAIALTLLIVGLIADYYLNRRLGKNNLTLLRVLGIIFGIAYLGSVIFKLGIFDSLTWFFVIIGSLLFFSRMIVEIFKAVMNFIQTSSKSYKQIQSEVNNKKV